jgi:hypothetical protein
MAAARVGDAATEGEQLRHFADWYPAIVEMITARPVSDRCGLYRASGKVAPGCDPRDRR